MYNSERIEEQSFWASLGNGFHICDDAFLSAQAAFNFPAEEMQVLSATLKHEGYLHLPSPAWNLPLKEMAELVCQIKEAGLPPVFSFVYDEFWALFFRLDNIFKSFLGSDYFMLPDCWVWHVDPRQNESGWKPHRDKKIPTVFPDGTPGSITTWIPLTEATPLNGCMYVVPRHLDRGGEKDGLYGFDLSSIRALPALPGNILMWNQYLFHWGGRTSPMAVSPRISVSFEFQSAKIPGLRKTLMKNRTIYSFEERLGLIAKQILQYQHMYPLNDSLREVAENIMKRVP